MGQQQETVAGSTLRRILLALLVAALMAAMMAASAMPATAKVFPEKPGQNGGGPPVLSGNNSGAVVYHGSGSACVEHLNQRETGGGC